MSDSRAEMATNKGRRPTVLAIDDDSTNLALLCDILKDRDLTILVAEDGDSGVERARYARPDLILLDVLLPGTDGFEICRRLKADATTAEIPVIFMTALSEADFKARGFECGGVDYITKPFERREVLARVGVHLRIRVLTESLEEANDSLSRRVAERTASLMEANKALEAGIAERETLLHEVHHRVKNNLQIMASLADISLGGIEDAAMRELWKDLANRIRAISEVHELLYRADNHSSIDIRDYLDRLASLLYQSYRGCFDEVRVTLDAEKVEIGLEQAVPCGMLVNEIMTNSFRHAFPRGLGRLGEIRVGLRSLPDSLLELTLSDNGIGLPPEIGQGDHVGISLISLLVDQLGGKMEVESGGGTLYRIRFKRDGADGLDARRAGEA
jgi:two-component sensor histidine kinase